MAIDFKKLGDTAVASGADQTKATGGGGGGDYKPPAAGPTRLRFIAYIELGKQKTSWQGKEKIKERVMLTFELSGPKHPPTITESGEKIPLRISITESLSLNEKANFYKLFNRMNYAGKAKHMVQLLGEAYKATVVHDTFKGKDGTDVTVAKLRNDSGYTIEPPRYEVVNPDDHEEPGPTGEFKVLSVAPAISQQRCFLWAHADMAQWASIFIDGEYEARKDKDGKITAPAKSKNVYQNTIKLALNFKGSPIHTLLLANGAPLDIPDAESGLQDEGNDDHDVTTDVPGQKPAEPATPAGAAATDALNGVV